ncbi:MAG: type II 3-dehydroquinate dehydratase [Flavobacteriales bacterium]|nr:type II 3-dehydroquinate dehydratase [Flavobacteriales bacterium]
MLRILILNGPNLNLLGSRETDIYGSTDLETLINGLRERFPDVLLEHMQSNVEGELVNALHEARTRHAGVVFNPGGYSHTSVALRDAVAAIGIPVVEVHLSNLLAREPFRHTSLVGSVAAGSIMGMGAAGYELAVRFLSGLR